MRFEASSVPRMVRTTAPSLMSSTFVPVRAVDVEAADGEGSFLEQTGEDGQGGVE